MNSLKFINIIRNKYKYKNK